MKRTELMDEYIKVVKELNKLEATKSRIRGHIINTLKESDEYEGIKLQEIRKTKFNDDEIIKWLKEEFPAAAKKCVILKEVLDYAIFEQLIAMEEIEYTELPSSAYTISKEFRITIDKGVNL